MFVNYNSYKYPGKFDKTVHVFTGDDGKNEDVIHVIGDVTPMPMGQLEVTPRKAVVEGLVNGQPTAHKVMVKNTGDAPMMVTKIESRKFKTTYWKGQIIVPAGETAGIDVTLNPNKAGRFMDIIMVHSDARNDIGKGYKGVLTGTAK